MPKKNTPIKPLTDSSDKSVKKFKPLAESSDKNSKKMSNEDARLAQVIQNIGAADRPKSPNGQPSGYRSQGGLNKKGGTYVFPMYKTY